MALVTQRPSPLAWMVSLCLLLLLASLRCSTLREVPEDKKTVTLSSEPLGAEVILDGNHLGKTPLAVVLPLDTDHAVILRKKGFREARARINRKVNPASILQLEGVLYWIVDVPLDAQWRFDRISAKAILEPALPRRSRSGDFGEALLVSDGLTVLPFQGRTAILEADGKTRNDR